MLDVFSYPFMQRALVAGLCIGLIAPLVGVFIVHRGMSFVGDTLAHAAFAGVAAAIFTTSVTGIPVSPTGAGLVVSALAALGIQELADRTSGDSEHPMAVILAASFALGTVLVSLADGGLSVGITQYLFGSITLVTPSNVRVLVTLTAGVSLVVALTAKQLFFITVDETAARVAGLRVDVYNRILVVLTAVVVAASMQILGVILVAAMVVVPVAAATQVARSFRHSIILGILIAELSVFLGLVLSFSYGLAAGGTVVLVAVACYVLAIAVGR